MPTQKADLYALYVQWQTRRPCTIEDVVGETAPTLPSDGNEQETPSLNDEPTQLVDQLSTSQDDHNQDHEEYIEAMLLLNGAAV